MDMLIMQPSRRVVAEPLRAPVAAPPEPTAPQRRPVPEEMPARRPQSPRPEAPVSTTA
jgi:hypothetical protein